MKHTRLPRVFTATGAVVLLVLTGVIVVGLLIDAVMRSGIANALLLAPWPLLLLWVVYVAGIASDIRANAAGVRVQNFLRRTWIPWARVTKMRMRWQLEFMLDDGSVVAAFGGPARSRPRRLAPDRARETENAEASDGIAALHKLRAEAEAEASSAVSPHANVVRTWDTASLGALGILVVWAIAAIMIAQM